MPIVRLPTLACRWFVFPLIFAAGCGGDPSGVRVPRYDPSGSSQAAIELYDANGNGSLEGAELARCPSLIAAMPRIDTDGNGKLTAAEISHRIAEYKSEKVGLMSIHCTILRNGRPLPKAKVTFVPEEFMNKSIEPASGVTDDQGMMSPKKDGLDFAGIQLGLYRVQVSLMGDSGVESLPAQFNTETTLGAELAPKLVELERGLVFDLK